MQRMFSCRSFEVFGIVLSRLCSSAAIRHAHYNTRWDSSVYQKTNDGIPLCKRTSADLCVVFLPRSFLVSRFSHLRYARNANRVLLPQVSKNLTEVLASFFALD